MISDLQPNDVCVIENFGKFYPAVVTRTNELFIWAKPTRVQFNAPELQFTKSTSGRQTAVVIHPAYIHERTKEIDKIIRRDEAIMVIEGVDWNDLNLDILEQVVDILERADG